MHIDFVEIGNFRKLQSTRVTFSRGKTVFVGANNSGKSSAMVALRYFLLEREHSRFALTDFTLCHWPTINAMGKAWEDAAASDAPLPSPAWESILPFLDVWLHVEDDEVHYVRHILPTLDWMGGLVGVRLRLEPNHSLGLQKDYMSARTERSALAAADSATNEDEAGDAAASREPVPLWPRSLTDFLKRGFRTAFCVRAYILDPTLREDPVFGLAKPQALSEMNAPVEGNPFKGLVQIDEIGAQRGFGRVSGSTNSDDEDGNSSSYNARRLSEQLRRYYRQHLDPLKGLDSNDLLALRAIENAQQAFDKRLEEGFSSALDEVEGMGYPGVTDPKLKVSTRLSPVDGLNHSSAVQYVVAVSDGDTMIELHLPEDSNGLGYQNLVSMVFQLMSFRDGWLRVGKAAKAAAIEDSFVPPLHLVLVEEPEAHLHTQVQQVFIRKAYEILRADDRLRDAKTLTTQLVVSTHSSHLAHACEFSSLRYFRRMPTTVERAIPTACVVNLSDVFGEDGETERFVTRYLYVTHCDLFFADAAVLIEGPAERILVPFFVHNQSEFKGLLDCYITWLEIGGSHAHRLKSLVEQLGLTTLIITDLDAMDGSKSIPPSRGAHLKSRNQTLKTWCPGIADLDELLDATDDKLSQCYEGRAFSIRVAYQRPVKIEFKGNEVEALANTLEDALVFENLEFFSSQPGAGLLRKFREHIEAAATIEDLSGRINSALSGGDKAELALDLMEIPEPERLCPPKYIQDGLRWLAMQLRKQQAELGLSQPEVVSGRTHD